MYTDNRPFFHYIPLILAAVLFAVFTHFYFWQTGDDSYIYFRYIDRALAGKWWSWSDHIAAVEGYSSPLWYVLLVATAKSGISISLAARCWGVVFSMLTVCGVWNLSRQLKAPVFLSGFACLLLALNQGFYYWATSGLETSLYAALLIGSCIGIIREKSWLLPTALIGIARPEGMFLLLAIIGSIFIVKRHLISVKTLFICLLPALLWLLLRWYIYSDILPNTFYAKATGNSLGQLFRGLIYSLPVLLPLLAAWLAWWKDKNQSVMIALGMVSMLLGIVFLGGGDWMFHFRLLIPLYGILLAVIAAQWLCLPNIKKMLLLISLIPFVLLSVPSRYLPLIVQGKQLPVVDYQEGTMTQVSIDDVAVAIKMRYPDASLIAVNHAGALPWALQEYNVIDMVGLNDAHIAKTEGQLHHKCDVDYVLDQKPDLIMLNSRVKPGTDGLWYHKGYWAGEDALVEHPDFANYQATDLVFPWHWYVPYPYSLVVKNAETSWIMVFERKH
jgi:hypothetical protein